MTTHHSSTGSHSPLPYTPTLRPSSVPPKDQTSNELVSASDGERLSPTLDLSDKVSSLHLPKPVISLIAPKPKSRSSRIGITPLTTLPTSNTEDHLDPFDPYGANGSLQNSIPRSFRSLGSSTLQPPLQPISLGSSTIKPNSYNRELGEYHQLIKNLKAARKASISSSVGGSSAGSRTVVPVKKGEIGGVVAAVDELGCEWCWFCGEERKRELMVLKEVGEGGMQWICRDEEKCGEEDGGEEGRMKLNVGEWGGERLRRISDGEVPRISTSGTA